MAMTEDEKRVKNRKKNFLIFREMWKACRNNSVKGFYGKDESKIGITQNMYTQIIQEGKEINSKKESDLEKKTGIPVSYWRGDECLEDKLQGFYDSDWIKYFEKLEAFMLCEDCERTDKRKELEAEIKKVAKAVNKIKQEASQKEREGIELNDKNVMHKLYFYCKTGKELTKKNQHLKELKAALEQVSDYDWLICADKRLLEELKEKLDSARKAASSVYGYRSMAEKWSAKSEN